MTWLKFCVAAFLSRDVGYKQNGPQHDKTNKMICAPSEDSDQPGHQPSLIRVPSCTQDQKLLHADSEDAVAQADLMLRWAHRSFCWFCHAAAQMWILIKEDLDQLNEIVVTSGHNKPRNIFIPKIKIT